MYTIGFQMPSMGKALINPAMCRTATDLLTWIDNFTEANNFKLEPKITIERLTEALRTQPYITLAFEDYYFVLLAGEDCKVMELTDRFVYDDSFAISSYKSTDV